MSNAMSKNPPPIRPPAPVAVIPPAKPRLVRPATTTTTTTPGTFPGVRIVDMPDLGTVTDTSSVVGERAGSGRFSAPQLRSYVLNNVPIVTPQQYGAKGDGVADDTAAFNAALAAIAAQGGGKLYIPSGDYRITGPLTYASGWLKIEGAGKNTVMQFGSTTADFMTFAGPDITLTDFSVATPYQTSTAGGLFNFTNSNNAKLNRIWTDGGYEIVQFGGDAAHIAYRTSITDCNFVNVMQNGVFYSAAYGGMGFISDTEMLGAPTNNGNGIIIEAGDTFSFTNVNIAAFKFGVNVVSTFLTGGYNYVANIFAANVLCDGAGSSNVAGLFDGWFFDGSAAGTYIARVHLSGCWAGTMGRNGFAIQNATDVTLSNCIAINCVQNGFLVDAPCHDITIIGCTATGNSVNSAGTYDGIHVAGVVTDFTITNCRSRPAVVSPSLTQRYGIQVDAAASDRYIITNNNLHGNQVGGLLDGGTGTSKFVSQNIL
jgi:hypothetical protein